MDFKKNIVKKIKNKTATICVIGLGYVGLPLAILSSKKFKCFGVDDNLEKLKQLRQSNKKNLFITRDYDAIKKSDIIIYALPTPLHKNNTPNLSILKKSLKKSKNFFRKGQLLILESTSYPGTTRDLFCKILKQNYIIGSDIFLSFSPERIDPGNKKFSLKNIPKIISGFSENCFKLSELFYSNICNKVVKASSLEEAEFSKIFENIFRAVNIGLVNETKQIAKKINVNFDNVLSLAETKPFGFMRFDPGPGVGGHCIPVDPFYLSWLAKEKGLASKFIELSGKINKQKPKLVFKEINKKIKKKNPKIIVLGISYKKNSSDLRNSPSLEIYELLIKKYNKVFFNDDFVKKINLNGKKILSTKISNYSYLKQFDCVIYLTNHTYYNKKMILSFSNKIYDTRGSFKQHDKVTQI